MSNHASASNAVVAVTTFYAEALAQVTEELARTKAMLHAMAEQTMQAANAKVEGTRKPADGAAISVNGRGPNLTYDVARMVVTQIEEDVESIGNMRGGDGFTAFAFQHEGEVYECRIEQVMKPKRGGSIGAQPSHRTSSASTSDEPSTP